jgi:serine/threonine-protein kinase
MTPDRWRRLGEVFEAALRSEAASRESVLRRACAGDLELRAEVDRLLAQDARAGAEGFLSFLDGRGAGAERGESLARYLGETGLMPRCPGCGEPLRPVEGAGGMQACAHCRADLRRDAAESGSTRPTVATVTGSWGLPGGPVLDSLAATIEPVPRLLLRDADGGPEPSLVRPVEEADAGPATRYRIDGEIARGGMGAVLRGRDSDLGRDVALKVLREDLRGNTEMIRRFVEEAQIGGQLQHPGVVPIYEMGTFGDRRPFFSMKLVKGHTLAELLGARTGRADGLPRFLAIFEAITQTVAYAHARGVIHRDLKPSNVMVGSFGEVQVMDWGLAKVLPRGGVVDDARVGKADHQETVIATARSGSAEPGLSHAGSVMGTPSYMAPEQARGEVDRADERIDVFALGSILCEILTGRPAFAGRSSGEVQRMAARGDLTDALSRLEDAGADAELVALAKDCLAPEREDRPREAGAVAARVTAYLAGVQDRLRSAERERAVAEATAVEERKRRRLQLGLAACLVILTALAGLGTAYAIQQRAARAAALEGVLGEANTLRDLARGNPEDVARWQAALAAVEQAEGVAGDDSEAARQLAALRDEAQAGVDAAERDRMMLGRLVDIRSAKADDRDGSTTDAAYADAFRAAGIDLSSLSPEAAGRTINARPPSVALALAAALDDWAAVRRTLRKDPAGAKRLADAARIADPDPWRNHLRDALEEPDQPGRQAALKALAGSARFEELGPVSLDVLGTALDGSGDASTAESVLRAARRRHPGDVWLNYDLARVLEKVHRRAEAIRYYTAARALRPETAHELAHALRMGAEPDEALAVFRDLVRLRPRDARHLACLGKLLRDQGHAEEAAGILKRAITASRQTIRLAPNSAKAHNTLGATLMAQGQQLDDAVAALREAVRLAPDLALAHSNLGEALQVQGKLDEAVTALREAVRLAPEDPIHHGRLGEALRVQGKLDEAVAALREAVRLEHDSDTAHNQLAVGLGAQGELEEAIAEYRTSIRLRPDSTVARYNLGDSLLRQGKYDEAIAAYRTLIPLLPDKVGPHLKIARVLLVQGKRDEAIAECRAAIRLEPDVAESHYDLGVVLLAQGKQDEAMEEYRATIRLQPDCAEAHCAQGALLQAQGRFREALTEFRKGHELGSRRPGWPHPSERFVRQAERMVALEGRLPAVIRGDEKPRDAAESLEFAYFGYQMKRFGPSARLFAEAFQADPKLAEDRQTQNRYNAACSASLAAAGQGQDNPAPDDAAKTQFRQQAFGWLKAEHAAWTKQLASPASGAREQVAEVLQHWRKDPDLAGVREPDALAQFPEPERAAWRTLWADVEALLERAEGGTP